MTITTIQVANVDDPQEVQTWLTSHSTATIIQFAVIDNIFYIIWK